MADDIPFDRDFDAPPGRVDRVAPNVRRILAPNPGPFTFTGTCSYIVGEGEVAILDPGPDDRAHIDAVLGAVKGEKVAHVFVTHTHRDHSPATAAVVAKTGAKVFAEGPHRAARPMQLDEKSRLDASADLDFMPDVRVKDGEIIEGNGYALEADDARPHHEPSSLCAPRNRHSVLGRSRNGLVDFDRGAARRRDGRLHGVGL